MTRPLLAALAAVTAAVAVLAALVLPGSAATVARDPLAPSVPATAVVTVRPVDASGRPAPGWTVTRLPGSVTCDGAAPSSVDAAITSCYPTAYDLRACYRSVRHTVLCLRDPRERSLVRVRYAGGYPEVVAPDVATPAGMTLADGRRCLLRVGGAWGAPAQHPQWVGWDSCTRGASVYAPGSSPDGVDRSRSAWTVRLWRTGADPRGTRLVTRRVATAYVVGVA